MHDSTVHPKVRRNALNVASLNDLSSERLTPRNKLAHCLRAIEGPRVHSPSNPFNSHNLKDTMSHEEQAEYLQAIRRVSASQKASVVTPEVLFDAADVAI